MDPTWHDGSNKVSISRTKARDCLLRTTLAPLLYSHGCSSRITSAPLFVIKLLLSSPGRKQEPQDSPSRFFEITRKLVGHALRVAADNGVGDPCPPFRTILCNCWLSSIASRLVEHRRNGTISFVISLGNSNREMLGKNSRKRPKKEEEPIDRFRTGSSRGLGHSDPGVGTIDVILPVLFVCLSMSFVAIACCGWRLGV